MLRTSSPSKFLSRSSLSSALALLMVFATALFAGPGAPRHSQAHQPLTRIGLETPVPAIKAYPKDFKRESDRRWRDTQSSDDLDSPDSQIAGFQSPAFLRGSTPVVLASEPPLQAYRFHRPQAARAPPIV